MAALSCLLYLLCAYMLLRLSYGARRSSAWYDFVPMFMPTCCWLAAISVLHAIGMFCCMIAGSYPLIVRQGVLLPEAIFSVMYADCCRIALHRFAGWLLIVCFWRQRRAYIALRRVRVLSHLMLTNDTRQSVSLSRIAASIAHFQSSSSMSVGRSCHVPSVPIIASGSCMVSLSVICPSMMS